MLGDPLEKLNAGIDFELFRMLLEDKLSKIPKAPGGRPPYDYVLMFKILILQRYYNLSDEQVEYQINDRMSFMRFLGLTIADDIPDSRTVWHFREQLTDLGLVDDLFSLFIKELEKLNLIVNEGKIIDASFVEVPRQRNSRDENAQIKEDEIPETFTVNPHKLSQKDTDARWTKKHDVNYYGYKNHVKQDAKSKLIIKYLVSDASVHDSNATDLLLDEKDKGEVFYADSAYSGEPQEAIIAEKEMINQVCEKGARNNPLTEEQIANNREKSRVRSRVEHIFGFMENSMNGMYIQCIGIVRATAIIGLMNLTYNMYRKIQLVPTMG
ncbi:MAG: IS5 family transposase [Bacteroidales bacterium]|nr:IS5 family transposase [Bacteroidales bacterium]